MCPRPCRARQLGEPLGLPRQHLVGHALEGLAEHHEAAGAAVGGGIAGTEMDVGQPAVAAAAAPLDGQHHQVEGVHRLHLHPAGAAAAGVPGGVEVLDHDSLVAGLEHLAVNASAAAGSAVTSRRTRWRSGTRASSAPPPLGAGHVE